MKTDVFFKAVEKGNIKEVEAAINNGEIDIKKVKTNNRLSPSFWACLFDQKEILKLLLKKGADANEKKEDGESLLSFAAFNSRKMDFETMAKILTQAGADVNYKQHTPESDAFTGYTPLHYAAFTGAFPEDSAKAAHILIKLGAAVNSVNSNKETPLHLAIYTHAMETAGVLIKNGADIEATDKDGLTPLLKAVYLYHYRQRLDEDHINDVSAKEKKEIEKGEGLAMAMTIEAIEFLSKNGSKIDVLDKNGETALTKAILDDMPFPIIKALIDAGADPNCYSVEKEKNVLNAFKCAIALKRPLSYIEYMIAKMPDINHQDKKDPNYYSPLLNAIGYQREDVVRLLLKRNGINLNIAGAQNTHPVFMASKMGLKNTVEMLVDGSAHVNCKTTDGGNTPLITASYRGHFEIVKYLISKGANVNAKADDGASSLSLAKEAQHKEIVNYLIKMGAKE